MAKTTSQIIAENKIKRAEAAAIAASRDKIHQQQMAGVAEKSTAKTLAVLTKAISGTSDPKKKSELSRAAQMVTDEYKKFSSQQKSGPKTATDMQKKKEDRIEEKNQVDSLQIKKDRAQKALDDFDNNKEIDRTDTNQRKAYDAERKRLQFEVDRAGAEIDAKADAKTHEANMEKIASMSIEDREQLQQYIESRDARRSVFANPISWYQDYNKETENKNALIDKYGEEEFDKLAETYSRQLHEQNAKKTVEDTQESVNQNWIAAALHNIAAVPARAMGGIEAMAGRLYEQVDRTGQYRTLEENTAGDTLSLYGNAVSGQTAQNIAGENGNVVRGALSLGYQGIMSIVDSIARSFFGGGATGGAALAATNSFTQTVSEATKQGASPQQAVSLGVAKAGMEYITEKIPMDEVFKAAKAGDVKVIEQAFKQMGIEITTEELTLFGSMAAEAAILREKSSYKQKIGELVANGKSYEEAKAQADNDVWNEVLQTAAVSGFAGFLSGSGAAIFGNLATNNAPEVTAEAQQEQPVQTPPEAPVVEPAQQTGPTVEQLLEGTQDMTPPPAPLTEEQQQLNTAASMALNEVLGKMNEAENGATNSMANERDTTPNAGTPEEIKQKAIDEVRSTEAQKTAPEQQPAEKISVNSLIEEIVNEVSGKANTAAEQETAAVEQKPVKPQKLEDIIVEEIAKLPTEEQQREAAHQLFSSITDSMAGMSQQYNETENILRNAGSQQTTQTDNRGTQQAVLDAVQRLMEDQQINVSELAPPPVSESVTPSAEDVGRQILEEVENAPKTLLEPEEDTRVTTARQKLDDATARLNSTESAMQELAAKAKNAVERKKSIEQELDKRREKYGLPYFTEKLPRKDKLLQIYEDAQNVKANGGSAKYINASYHTMNDIENYMVRNRKDPNSDAPFRKDKDLARALFQMARDPQKFGAKPLTREMHRKATGSVLNRTSSNWIVPIGNNRYIAFNSSGDKGYNSWYDSVHVIVMDGEGNRIAWSGAGENVETFIEVVNHIKRDTGLTKDEWLALPVTQQALEEYYRQKPLDEAAGRTVEALKNKTDGIPAYLDAVGDLLTEYEAVESEQNAFTQENAQKFAELKNQRGQLRNEVAAAQSELDAAKQNQGNTVQRAVDDFFANSKRETINSTPTADTLKQSTEDVQGIKGTGAAEQNFTGKAEYQNLLSDDNVQRDRPGDVRPMDVPKTDSFGKHVSELVGNAYGAEITTDKMANAIEELVQEGALGFDVRHNQDSMNTAAEKIAQRGVAATRKQITNAVASGKIRDGDVEQAILLYAMYNSKDTPTAIDNASEILVDLATMANITGRNLQMFRLLRKMTPEGQVTTIRKTVQSNIDSMIKSGAVKKGYTTEIDPELLAEYRKAAGENMRAVSEEQKKASAEKMKTIMDAIYAMEAAKMPATMKAKWDAWRYMAMLGNAKTQVRNIAGNLAFKPYKEVKDKMGALAEKVLVSKDQRTKSLFTDQSLVKWARQDAKTRDVHDALKYSAKLGDDVSTQKIRDNMQVFNNKALDSVRKFVESVPSAGDMLFKNNYYVRSLAGFLKARGYKATDIQSGKVSDTILAEARAYAIQEAMKATFNDSNAFSDFMATGLRYKGDNPFGKALNIAAEGVLPFRRTPANIAVRFSEYSPVGIAKGLWSAATKVRNGEMTAATAIDQLTSGLTGSAVMALGFALAGGMNGIKITGSGADEDEKRQGHQDYALEFSVDGQEYSYKIDWAAPANLPLFVGANIYSVLENAGENTDVSKFTSFIRGMGTAFEPMLALSCMSGLNNLLESARYAEEGEVLYSIVAEAATGYFTQGIPALVRQTYQATQENKQTTFTKSDDPTIRDLQQTAASIPFAGAEYQTDKRNAWGEKESQGDWMTRAFNSFVNPGTLKKIDNSAAELEISRLNKAGYNVTPNTAARTVSYIDKDGTGHDDVRLTEEQFQKLAETQGQTARKLLDDMISSASYAALTDEQKADAIDTAYLYARKTGEIAAIEDHTGYDQSWFYDVEKGGAEEIIRRVLNSGLNTSMSDLDTAWDRGYNEETFNRELETAYESYRNAPAEMRKQVYAEADGTAKKYIEARDKGVSHEDFVAAAENIAKVKGTGSINKDTGKATVRDIDRRQAIANTAGMTEKEIDIVMKAYMADYDPNDESLETTEMKYDYIRHEMGMSAKEYAATYRAYLDSSKKAQRIAAIRALGYDYGTALKLYKVYSGSMKKKLIDMYG